MNKTTLAGYQALRRIRHYKPRVYCVLQIIAFLISLFLIYIMFVCLYVIGGEI